MLTMRLLVAPTSLLALRAIVISAAEHMIAYKMTVIFGDGGHPWRLIHVAIARLSSSSFERIFGALNARHLD